MGKIALPTEADFRTYMLGVGRLNPRVNRMLEVFAEAACPSGRQYFQTENRKSHLPGPGIRSRYHTRKYIFDDVFVELARDDSLKYAGRQHPVFALTYIYIPDDMDKKLDYVAAVGFDTTDDGFIFHTPETDHLKPLFFNRITDIMCIARAQRQRVFSGRSSYRMPE